jgi:membrane associated rhomboid family serine protease
MIPIRDSIVIRTTPVIVYVLIAANAAMFLYQISLGERAGQVFLYEHALVPLRYDNPQWALYQGLPPDDYLPFVTSFFMHGGWLHILFNMWTLYIFGSSVESRYGSIAFLVFYLICGVAANLAHVYFNQSSPIPVLGASGAVAGIICAYAVTFPKARLLLVIPIIIIPLFLELPALTFVALWFGLQVLQGAGEMLQPSMGGGIAWWAHIGGFLAGIVLLPLLWLGGIGRKNAVYDAGRSFSAGAAPNARRRPYSIGLPPPRPRPPDSPKTDDGTRAAERSGDKPWTPGPWG